MQLSKKQQCWLNTMQRSWLIRCILISEILKGKKTCILDSRNRLCLISLRLFSQQSRDDNSQAMGFPQVTHPHVQYREGRSFFSWLLLASPALSSPARYLTHLRRATMVQTVHRCHPVQTAVPLGSGQPLRRKDLEKRLVQAQKVGSVIPEQKIPGLWWSWGEQAQDEQALLTQGPTTPGGGMQPRKSMYDLEPPCQVPRVDGLWWSHIIIDATCLLLRLVSSRVHEYKRSYLLLGTYYVQDSGHTLSIHIRRGIGDVPDK